MEDVTSAMDTKTAAGVAYRKRFQTETITLEDGISSGIISDRGPVGWHGPMPWSCPSTWSWDDTFWVMCEQTSYGHRYHQGRVTGNYDVIAMMYWYV